MMKFSVVPLIGLIASNVLLLLPGKIQQQQTFTVLLGPVLTRQQFFRSVSTASLNNTGFYIHTANPDNSCNWQIVNADADWDDESGQVELRIEVAVGISGANNSAQIAGVGFNVSILASLPA